MDTDNFELLPPDENTIYCDIDLLNRAYNFILENYTISEIQTSTGGEDDIDLPWLVSDCSIDSDPAFLLTLDKDVLSYLMPKLKYLLEAHDKIDDYLGTATTMEIEYIEHDDNISNYADVLCGKDSGPFQCHDELTLLLKEKKSSFSAADLESELFHNFEYKHEVRGEYSNNPDGYIINSGSINEVESQIDIPDMLTSLELTKLDARGLESILEKLSQEYCFNAGNINGLEDTFIMTVYIGSVIYFYYAEKQVLEAINNLENKDR
jgi:hypothetical protein